MISDGAIAYGTGCLLGKYVEVKKSEIKSHTNWMGETKDRVVEVAWRGLMTLLDC